MKAMILAAGRGERMRPLTDNTPKPLLEIKGKPLIVHQLEALHLAGVSEFVINTGVMGNQIRDRLGNGSDLGVNIVYSDEGDSPLETAGGIIKALPLLGDQPFIVANADIFTDFDYRKLPQKPEADVHLVLVNNPDHHPEGDFFLENSKIIPTGTTKYTFSGIGLYQPDFFSAHENGHQPLAPLLFAAIDEGRVTGQLHTGYWNDVGTPARLEEVNNYNK